jgi:hypothetical protein
LTPSSPPRARCSARCTRGLSCRTTPQCIAGTCHSTTQRPPHPPLLPLPLLTAALAAISHSQTQLDASVKATSRCDAVLDIPGSTIPITCR